MVLDVRQQAERIIDEGDGASRSVIVRMASVDDGREDDGREGVLRAAAYRMQQRSLSLRARDVLPAAVSDDPKLTAKKRSEERRFGVPAQL